MGPISIRLGAAQPIVERELKLGEFSNITEIVRAGLFALERERGEYHEWRETQLDKRGRKKK